MLSAVYRLCVPFLLATLSLTCLPVRSPAYGLVDNADKADKKEETKKILPPASCARTSIAVAVIRNRLASKATEGEIAPPAEFEENLTERLISGLMNSKRFVVYDSKPSDFSLESLPLGVITDPDSSAAVKAAGNGAAYLLTGEVTQYTNKKGSGGLIVGGSTMGGKSGTASLEIDLRIIGTVKGEVVSIVHVWGRGVTHIHRDGCFGTVITRADALGAAEQEAVNNAVKGICQDIEKEQTAKTTVSKPIASPSAPPL